MIPIFDITRQNKILKKELDEAIASVIEKGIFILGPKVAEFEQEFAKYIGVKYAVGVASGTDAISLALMAIGVGQGDEVIMPANAYPSVFAVTAIGAIPKLADIDPATFNIDASKITRAISPKTKAILPVHLYGQPADMEKIVSIGKQYNIPVIEDCAQAAGAEIRITNYELRITNSKTGNDKDTPGVAGIRQLAEGFPRGGGMWKKAGSIGAVGCFSFYPTKNLGAFGDGGMVVTDNEEIYKKVKLLRMYGEEARYNSIILGKNSRLDELQAAILLVKLKYLEKWNLRRRQIAQLYFSHFFGCSKKLGKERAASAGFLVSLTLDGREETSLKQSSTTPHLHLSARETYENAAKANNHVYHLFVIRSKKRDQLKAYLEEKRIGTAIHYPVPIHLVPSMKFLGYKKGDFPESEKACGEVLSLPIYPEITNDEVRHITKNISQFS